MLTIEGVEAKLKDLQGNMAAVARAFGCSRQAVWKFVQGRQTLLAVQHDLREGMKDHAESALHAALLRGEAWAVCFFLKTQAKDRGYVERQEMTGRDGEPLHSQRSLAAQSRANFLRLAATLRERAEDDAARRNGQPGPGGATAGAADVGL
jgi:hypothetical protein